MDRYKFTDMAMCLHNEGAWVRYDKAMEEIESLREQLEIREKEYQAALRHGDEWKRRCKKALSGGPMTAEEAKNWFEEE